MHFKILSYFKLDENQWNVDLSVVKNENQTDFCLFLQENMVFNNSLTFFI